MKKGNSYGIFPPPKVESLLTTCQYTYSNHQRQMGGAWRINIYLNRCRSKRGRRNDLMCSKMFLRLYDISVGDVSATGPKKKQESEGEAKVEPRIAPASWGRSEH
jgi:hypothetical protein